MKKKNKVAVVMPAYNAEKTLARTYKDLPMKYIDDIILVDDCSRDKTVELSQKLGIHTIRHKHNLGYGGNQKTCYTTALKRGADIIVMVHPDHQYDPKVIPDMVKSLSSGKFDAVFGSRMLEGDPLGGGMPKWKYFFNISLSALANILFGIYLTEYHSGLRAYTRKYLENINFMANSNDFVFDTEIIAQGVNKRFRIKEVPIPTRYFKEASSIGLMRSIIYGLSFVNTLLKYKLYKKKLIKYRIFD